MLAIGGVPAERDLGPWLLAAALLLLAADLRDRAGAARAAARGPRLAAAGAVLLAVLAAAPAQAQRAPAGDSDPALATRLAYVVTGDASVDETQRIGLVGLSDFVNRRTAAALADPAAVTPGQDDLSLLSAALLAVAAGCDAAATPQAVAGAERLHAPWRHHPVRHPRRRQRRGLRHRRRGGAAPRRRRGLAIPPLAPLTRTMCSTRAFYLLQDFPGRFAGGRSGCSATRTGPMTASRPVIIGGHDWAAAWAVDARGSNPYAVIPGGARQRTLAYRFGVNLVMYALTGNYKGDQVHVPAILERLGQ